MLGWVQGVRGHSSVTYAVGGGGVSFPGKKHYKGSTLLVLRGGEWGQIPRKKVLRNT